MQLERTMREWSEWLTAIRQPSLEHKETIENIRRVASAIHDSVLSLRLDYERWNEGQKFTFHMHEELRENTFGEFQESYNQLQKFCAAKLRRQRTYEDQVLIWGFSYRIRRLFSILTQPDVHQLPGIQRLVAYQIPVSLEDPSDSSRSC